MVILISGPQGSGKTTITQELIRAMNIRKGFELFRPGFELKFADPIYDIHNYAREYLMDNGIKMVNKKDGPLLQHLGTEWGRNTYGENIWVDIAKNRVKKFGSRCTFIVSDCRFRNEFSAFPEALRIRLNAREEIRKVRCEMWRENTKHQSEIDLDGFELQGLFDMHLDTGKINVEGCVELILAQIQKGDWMEKRTTGYLA